MAHAAINAAGLAVMAREALFNNDQHYLTVWNLRDDASQLSVELLRQAKVYNLSCEKCDPQPIVLVFSLQRRAKLVLGNLHTRTPHGENIKVCTRKAVVQEALEHLERTASELTQGASDGASQPVGGGAS